MLHCYANNRNINAQYMSARRKCWVLWGSACVEVNTSLVRHEGECSWRKKCKLEHSFSKILSWAKQYLVFQHTSISCGWSHKKREGKIAWCLPSRYGTKRKGWNNKNGKKTSLRDFWTGVLRVPSRQRRCHPREPELESPGLRQDDGEHKKEEIWLTCT